MLLTPVYKLCVYKCLTTYGLLAPVHDVTLLYMI